MSRPENRNLLRKLARDIAEDNRCNCTNQNGDEPRRCPCGGDGMDDGIVGDRPFEGCWHCQAKAALNQRRRP